MVYHHITFILLCLILFNSIPIKHCQKSIGFHCIQCIQLQCISSQNYIFKSLTRKVLLDIINLKRKLLLSTISRLTRSLSLVRKALIKVELFSIRVKSPLQIGKNQNFIRSFTCLPLMRSRKLNQCVQCSSENSLRNVYLFKKNIHQCGQSVQPRLSKVQKRSLQIT